MAARCGWSILSRVSAPPRWWLAPVAATSERRRGRYAGASGVDGLARSAGLGEGRRRHRGAGRAGAAMVSLAARDLHGDLDHRGAADDRAQSLPGVAAAADLPAADRAGRARIDRNAVVRRGLGRALLCAEPDRETADPAV